MKNNKKTIFQTICFIICLCLIPTVQAYSSTKAKSKKKQKTTAPLSNIALVIHGIESYHVFFHQFKKQAVAGGIGGIPGMIIASTSKKKLSKAQRKDQIKQNEINRLLIGWQGNRYFKESFTKNLSPRYLQITQVILGPQAKQFNKVDKNFYKNSKFAYKKPNNQAYDYTPLVNQGIDHVIVVSLSNTLMPSNVFGKKMIPASYGSVVAIDLKKKEVLGYTKTQKVGGSYVKKSIEDIQSNPGEFKNGLTQLTQFMAEKLALNFSKYN